MSNRIAFLDVFCGSNGTGKTTLLKKCLAQLMDNGNRILVVTPDPVEWQELQEIKKDSEIRTFIGARRMIYDDMCMYQIKENLHNAVLVLDDCRVYIGAQRDDVMTWLQIRRRQYAIDLYCVFHGLTEIPPKFFTFASRLFLFNTNDNIATRSNYLTKEKFDLIQERKKHIANLINEDRSKQFYFEILPLDNRFSI